MLNEREWTYHKPTAETSPKYTAIRGAESAIGAMIRQIRTESGDALPSHDDINAAVMGYAKLIDDLAPDSADKSAAIRCCRLLRNALNEARVQRSTNCAQDIVETGKAHPERPGTYVDRVLSIAEAEAIKARWQANAAIALGG